MPGIIDHSEINFLIWLKLRRGNCDFRLVQSYPVISVKMDKLEHVTLASCTIMKHHWRLHRAKTVITILCFPKNFKLFALKKSLVYQFGQLNIQLI